MHVGEWGCCGAELRAEYQRDLLAAAAKSKSKKVAIGVRSKKVKLEGPRPAAGTGSDSGSEEEGKEDVGEEGPVVEAGAVVFAGWWDVAWAGLYWCGEELGCLVSDICRSCVW
jgi:hypothetical protein